MTEKKPEDNPDLIKSLEDFNKGSAEEEAKTSPEGKETLPEGQTTKEIETPSKEDVTKWLIDNKFKDDEEGRKALVKGYSEIQGRAEKAENAYKPYEGKEEYFETLSQLDSFLQNNQKVVKAMQKAMKEGKEIKVPPKPEDYDILDESINGSTSQKWREEQDQYLVRLGAFEATKKVDVLRQELSDKDEQIDFKQELKELGLSSAEMKEFDTFIKKSENTNTKTLVDYWRFLKQPQTKTKVEKEVTAAAIPGLVPAPVKPEEKELEKFWSGIMEHSH